MAHGCSSLYLYLQVQSLNIDPDEQINPKKKIFEQIQVCSQNCWYNNVIIVYFSFQVDLHLTSDRHVTYKGMLMRTVQGEITVKTMTSASIK